MEQVAGSNVVLLWLDEHICRHENCRKLKEEFENNTTSIYLYHDVEQCRRFVDTVKHKKLFCIVQGKHAQTLVPFIAENTIEPVVYIFCLHIIELNEWAQTYNCILNGGMFDHEADLLTKLTRDLADYAELKAQEYRMKKRACENWARNLTENTKRFHAKQCTLIFKTDPFSDQETPCEQST
ncbi:hypothetical protein I4U23_029872 [Adineta vaga]|nr:hypothetical protein I4U23_029872 [Adineta vaga]